MTHTPRSIDNLLEDADGLAFKSLNGEGLDEPMRHRYALVAQAYATIALVEALRASRGISEDRIRELIAEAIDTHGANSPHMHADGSTY
jgi:hypothetical protein